jgi:hypothetical protein
LFGIAFIALPFSIFKTLWNNMLDLNEPKFRFKNGWMYVDLSHLEYEKSIFLAVFYIRRAIYAIILVFLSKFPILQMIAHLNLSVFNLIYVGNNNPFMRKW